jgi:two-component system, NarL family, captular synthesis response regulator RcsB
MKRDCRLRRWLIADSTAMYAEGLLVYLQNDLGIETIDIASSRQELIGSMSDNRHDLLIIDPYYPHGESWSIDLNCLYDLREHDHDMAIIVFTTETDPTILQNLARIERTGVVSKRDDLSHLLDVCDRVISGERGAASPTIARLRNQFH